LLEPLLVHDFRPGDDLTRARRDTAIVAASADGSTFVGISRFVLDGPTPEPQQKKIGRAAFRWTEGTGVVSLGYPSSLPLADPREGGCEAEAVSSDAAVVFGSCVNASGVMFYRWTPVAGFELLPIPNEWAGVHLRAITPDGTVLVGDAWSLPHAPAFRWSPPTGLVALDHAPGAVENQAASVTAAGDVVFGSSLDSNSSSDAFRWTPQTGTVTLPRLPGAVSCGVITTTPPRDGSIIAGKCVREGGNWDAYRWTESAGTAALGAPDGYTSIQAWGMSRDGSVVTGFALGAGPDAAFRWTEASGSVVIAPARVVTHMSDDGSVIVGSAVTSAFEERVFRWTEAAGAVDLLPLASDTYSGVTSLSSDGATIVGVSYEAMTAGNPPRAVMWDADGKAHLIADLLQAAGADLRGTILTEVESRDGRLFWGQGIIPSGERRAWVARLPQ
jgi:uncharacterized membrane protein